MRNLVEALVPGMAAGAAALDAAGRFPAAEIAALAEIGALRAPLPVGMGGQGAGTEPEGAATALAVLMALGRGNLAVARLWEAHVNALRLIVRYGDAGARGRTVADVRDGHLYGLWVTDAGAPVRAAGDVLAGAKGPCSGAGHCTRALVTAEEGGGVRMAVVALTGAEAVTPIAGLQGMRAAANGVVRLDGVAVRDWLGAPGDYLREPDFSAGAWRASAASVGALQALVAATAAALRDRGQAASPLQQARFGDMLVARETGRLWMERVAPIAEGGGDRGAMVATVGLGRAAVEAACLDAIRLAQRSLGLAAFVAPQPVERIARDLATYLRQPAPDAVLMEAAAWHLQA